MRTKTKQQPLLMRAAATLLLIIAALAAGQTAWADATFQVPVGIIGMTNGSQSTYVIKSPYVEVQNTVSGTEKNYENVTGKGDYTGSNSQFYYVREPELSDFNRFSDGAYEIASQRDLDYLARIVNGKGNSHNTCNGVSFRQTADIAYSYTSAWDDRDTADNNFTPIGGFARSFEGTYDGQGHTISVIRARKTGTGNGDSSIGLFGYISGGGTVKNVVLSDAQFWGHQNIGGIVGCPRAPAALPSTPL